MTPYRTILVTGGGGWLGKNLIKYFQTNQSYDTPDDIRIFIETNKSLPNELSSENITIYKGNLTQKSDISSFLRDTEQGLLLHTAGVIHPKFTKRFYEVNHQVTKHLLRQAAESGIQRFITISSSASVGYNSTSNESFDEQAKYNPVGPYGHSKMLMEKETKKYWPRNSLNTTIIRPPWFYGPFGPPRQNRFFKLIKRGLVPVIGNGKNRRSMVFVPKLCEGIVKASLKACAGNELYWIADENPYPYQKIIKTIRKVLKNKHEAVCRDSELHLPSWSSTLLHWTSRSLTWLGFHNKTLRVLSELDKNISCTVTKAKKELNYSPNKTLFPGMSATIKEIFG